jgi:hypothetical protein
LEDSDFVIEGLRASEEEMERRRAMGQLPKRCLGDQARAAQWFPALCSTTLIFPE